MRATKMRLYSVDGRAALHSQFRHIGIVISVMFLIILLARPAIAEEKARASKTVSASVTILRPIDTVSLSPSTQREKQVQFTSRHSIRDCRELLGPDTPLHRAQQCQLNLIELN